MRIIVILLLLISVDIYKQDNIKIANLEAKTPYSAELIFRMARPELQYDKELKEGAIEKIKAKFLRTGLYKNIEITLINCRNNYCDVLFEPEYVKEVENFEVGEISLVDCGCLHKEAIIEMIKQKQLTLGYRFIQKGIGTFIEKVEKATKDVHTWQPEKKEIIEKLSINWTNIEKIDEYRVKITISFGCSFIEN